MDTFWLVTFSVVAAAALVQAVLAALQTWEHRRYARSRLRRLDRHDPKGRAMIFAPCKGVDVGLEENLRRLLDQHYDDYGVTFVVQSVDDPACGPIRRLMAEPGQIETHLVIAGEAEESGQKVHNLMAATRQLPPDIKYLAFIDSDARPRQWWLRALLSRLDRDDVGAASGYRWFIPDRPTLANHLLYGINCSVGLLLGSRGRYPVWGGSWAIRRDVFESIGLRQAWKGTLSDDLVATRTIRQNRLRVLFEPGCMVASPLRCTSWQAFSFVRRQYLITRFYAPAYWAFALGVTTLGNIGLLGSLAVLGWGLATGTPSPWIPAAVCAVLCLLYMARGRLRQDVAKTYFPHADGQLLKARRFDAWAGPLVGLAHWAGVVSSLAGRHITWRGITYRLFPGGRTRIVQRNDLQRSRMSRGSAQEQVGHIASYGE